MTIERRASLDVATLTLIWFVLIAALSAFAFVIRLGAKVDDLTGVVSETRARLEAHASVPAHPLTMERLHELDTRVRVLEVKSEPGGR